jgi:3-phosphoshikimate 1-carboxyvinyltransferase
VIETAENSRPPLTLRGGHSLTAIRYDMPLPSAQVKSALLLAGLYAEGTTVVHEPAPTRDHTERMLQGFGRLISAEDDSVSVRPGRALTPSRIDVPADLSSAAFFLVAASIAPGSELLLEGVGVNPTRTGVIEVLRLMGADITLQNPREAGAEPVADLHVRHAPLKGITIPQGLVPLATDDFPAIFIAAACAEGRTVLRGAQALRAGESDRIRIMADGLATLGIAVEVTADGIIIDGGAMGGGEINAQADPRIAMAFSIASLRAASPIHIQGCAAVATSFPSFLTLCAQVGIRVTQEGQS